MPRHQLSVSVMGQHALVVDVSVTPPCDHSLATVTNLDDSPLVLHSSTHGDGCLPATCLR